MPLRVDIKRKFLARSDRVKCVDIHPTEPWILASLYNGHVYIWNYTNSNLVKTFEVTDLPVRTAKFVPRKQWVVIGADDMRIYVYNYNTMEKLKTFEAHSDYIRCLAVHPTLPYLLSSSDDMLIKLWDWDKGWNNTMVFEGHTHYVMMITINPKDPNTFASASLDKTIKVWGFNSPTPHFTLEGHDKGVNCLEYFPGGEKPFLVSGADDKTVKVWDYQNRTCVHTLDGHTHNVSVVCFHPELPIILSGSEDGSVRVWHANTYRLERTLNYGLERVWAISSVKGSNAIALGYDQGAIMIKIGKEAPVVSMDQSGKIIWAKHTEIQTANIKTIEGDIADGERLQLTAKELGRTEVYPQTLKHNSNGRFVAVCGDGEYTIYTALAWRNKSFGSALDVVWASDGGEYAVRESTSKIVVFNKNFKEQKTFRPSYSAEAVYGGALLGVRSNNFVCLYDWDQCRIVRKIDVCPKGVYWSESGEHVVLACESSFYILKYNKDLVAKVLESDTQLPEDGIEDAFDDANVHEINEKVRTGYWAGDCFIYNNGNNRLNYCVGGNVVTISHLDRHMYILGYIPRDSRVYLIDKQFNVVSYSLHLSIVNYQTAILRGDFPAAEALLPSIPKEQRNRVAQFLDLQGLKDLALEVSTDPEHKFELALQLGKLEVAHEIAKETESDHKWKQLADLALSRAKFDLAEHSLRRAEDLGGLLLLYTSLSNATGIAELAELAVKKDQNNIAFLCYFLLHRIEDCISLLCNTGRIPEAAFMARTYFPGDVSRLVKLWREDLKTINEKAAESLADPMEYENLFPDLQWALKAQEEFVRQRKHPVPAESYLDVKDTFTRDVIEELKLLEADAVHAPVDDDSAPTQPDDTPAAAPTDAAVPEVTVGDDNGEHGEDGH